MRRWWLAAAVLVLLGDGAAQGTPLAAYGQLPSVDFVALSPDGSKLAMIVGDEGERQLQVRRSADRALLQRVGIGAAKVRGVQWVGDHHLLLTRSATAEIAGMTGPKREYSLVLDINLATGKSSTLLQGSVDDKDETLNTIFGEPMARMVGGRPVAFLPGLTFPGREGILTLFAVDLETRRTRQVVVGNSDTSEFLVDAAGGVIARVDYHQASGHWMLYTGRSGHLVKAMEDTSPLDSPWLAGLGRTAGSVLVGMHDDDETVFRELALGEATPSPPIPELANGTPVTDPASGVTIGASRHDELAVDYRFLSPADGALWAKVRRGFGDAVVHLESWSDDRRTVVLRVEGKAFGAGYFLLDVATHRADWLADEYLRLPPEVLGEKRAIHYTAADGTEIPAYLTLPPGTVEAKRLPLVVLAHGGPAARDDPGFDWWAQALASRGYAVLQPQFRGSSGFGGRFLAAGYGQWGRKMQTDLSDGVRALAARGIADPARTCIVGGSYGGYAALAGVTLQHGVYRCAVALAGPADLKAMLDYEHTFTGGKRNRTMRYWQRFMGATSANDPMLATISPLASVAAADAPILLIHGTDDTVVPFDQSKVMAAALTRVGKPVELVRLASEDHWLSRSATRTAMLDATVSFLGKHLPTDAPPPQ